MYKLSRPLSPCTNITILDVIAIRAETCPAKISTFRGLSGFSQADINLLVMCMEAVLSLCMVEWNGAY